MNSLTAKEKACAIRTDIIEMVHEAGSGHPGGSLSCTDILSALYFGGVLKHDPSNPKWDERDYFILGKGHAAPALYATLAEAGYLPVDELKTLRKLGTRLQGHPDSNLLPCVEVSTGSLGQGLSIGAGLAAGMKLEFLYLWVMANVKKDKFGKLPPSLRLKNSVILLQLLISTDSRSTVM